MSFRGSSIYEKSAGTTLLNAKERIVKKINVLVVVHSCLGKHSSLSVDMEIYTVYICAYVCVGGVYER